MGLNRDHWKMFPSQIMGWGFFSSFFLIKIRVFHFNNPCVFQITSSIIAEGFLFFFFYSSVKLLQLYIKSCWSCDQCSRISSEHPQRVHFRSEELRASWKLIKYALALFLSPSPSLMHRCRKFSPPALILSQSHFYLHKLITVSESLIKTRWIIIAIIHPC